MKKILLLLVIIMITGCANDKNELHKILKNNNYVIVDVRTPSEYNHGHIKNAINISYDKINNNVKLDKNKVILVYCMSGKRSEIAYKKLVKMGYDAYDLGAYENINMEKE